MKHLIPLLVLSVAALAGVSASAKEPTAQQGKMASCNKDAGDKKGDERKAFMKECLSAKPAEAAASAGKELTPQQQKMKDCNAEAKAGGKSGADRKAFMKECLSKK
jgi:hypothetical protein